MMNNRANLTRIGLMGYWCKAPPETPPDYQANNSEVNYETNETLPAGGRRPETGVQ